MNTWTYLTAPELRGLYWPGLIAGVAIALLCAVLSVFVVLKRLAFIGQGISHAAFGGIGLAAILGLTATTTAAAPYLGIPQFLVVTGFCLAAALSVGWLSERGAAQADTAIGIVLVGSMALGAILLARARTGLAWESFLFGTLFNVTPADAVTAWLLAITVVLVLWYYRRGVVFWAFDEPAARAFGVSTGRMRLLLMVLLALATVTAMKLAGVVLATAMLVMPGAIALRLSRRLRIVQILSLAIALCAVLGGLVLSFELDWQPGPAIVAVLTALFTAAFVLSRRSGALPTRA